MRMKRPHVFINTFFRVNLPLIAAFLLCLMLLSCDQDAIFRLISIDQEASKPRIDGTPSQIVVYDSDNDGNDEIYVGSLSFGNTKIHIFDGSAWREIDAGGNLGGLAVTSEALYVLTGPVLGARVIKEYKGSSFTARTFTVPADYSISCIYSANDYLFAGLQLVENTETCALAYVDTSDPSADTNLAPETKVNSLLSGAAALGLDIYLSTNGNGIWKFSAGSLGTVPLSDPETDPKKIDTAGKSMVGIIEHNGTIYAVDRPSNAIGNIYKYDGTDLSSHGSAYFTGGMAMWKHPTDNTIPELLLLGVDDNAAELYYGYREVLLSSNLMTTDIHTPRDTVESQDSYSNSLGMHAVNFILQVPESVPVSGDYASEGKNSVIFAATQTKGLWSYKKRDGKWSWNAQE